MGDVCEIGNDNDLNKISIVQGHIILWLHIQKFRWCILDKLECESPAGSPCENNGTCINTLGSYQCDCTEGWQSHNCENGECLVIQLTTAVSWLCLYLLQIFILIFLDINECLVKYPCENNATCVNNDGSYNCDCVEGWRGKNCQTGRYFLRVF